MSQHYDEALAPAGITLNQYSILSKLVRAGPTPQQALAALLVMDRSSLGHLLRPLEARGLVSVGMAPADRRRRIVGLTPAGGALMQQARRLWEAAEQRFETRFGAEPASVLRRVLRQVTLLELKTS
nr:MarR family winged helix-turn-helix transcriptional regulator [uncultured Lichenicoccus sp.]